MSLANFLRGSYYEFKDKVEWPKWPDLQSSTIVVTVTTVLLSLFAFGVDEFFAKILQNIISILVNAFN